MKPDLRKFLNAIKERKKSGGVRLAFDYAKTLSEIIEKNADQYLGLGGLASFKRSLRESQVQPVYYVKDMTIQTAERKEGKVGDIQEISVAAQKLFKKEEKSGIQCCMKMEAVLTSRRKDRDGDILEPDGAEIDPQMPLLSQHNACLPIGRYFGTVKKSKELIKGALGIADTPLGNDHAVLVEFGALRISHGFNPKEFEPLEEEEGDQRGFFPGWHVTRYEMCEVSLVSIPSNVDAVITAYKKEKLSTPLMKCWAQTLFEKRKRSTATTISTKDKAGTNATGNGSVTVNVHLNGDGTVVTPDKKSKGPASIKNSLDNLQSVISKKIEAIKKKRVSKTEEEDPEAEEESQAEEADKTLLETVREQLQGFFNDESFSEEHKPQVYDMIIQVSEAIGAERHEAGTTGKDDSWDSMTTADDEEDDPEQEVVDEPEEEDEEEPNPEEEEEDEGKLDDENSDMMAEDEEEDEEKPRKKEDDEEEDGKGCHTSEDEQPGWDGEDTDDENVGEDGPPKGYQPEVVDAAEYLLLSLSAGKRVSRDTLKKLKQSIETAL